MRLNAGKQHELKSDKRNRQIKSITKCELKLSEQQKFADKDLQLQLHKQHQQNRLSRQHTEQQQQQFSPRSTEQQEPIPKQQLLNKQQQQHIRQQSSKPNTQLKPFGSQPSYLEGDGEIIPIHVADINRVPPPGMDSSFLVGQMGSTHRAGAYMPDNYASVSSSDPQYTKDTSHASDSGRIRAVTSTTSHMTEGRNAASVVPTPSARSRSSIATKLNSKDLRGVNLQSSQTGNTSYISNPPSYSFPGRKASPSSSRSPSITSMKDRESTQKYSPRTCRVSSAEDRKMKFKSSGQSPQQPAPRPSISARRASSPSKDTIINNSLLNRTPSVTKVSADDLTRNPRHGILEGGDRRSPLSSISDSYSGRADEAHVNKRTQKMKSGLSGEYPSGFLEERKEKKNVTGECAQKRSESSSTESDARPLGQMARPILSPYQSGELRFRSPESLTARPLAAPRISAAPRPSAASRPSFHKAEESLYSANSVNSAPSGSPASIRHQQQKETSEKTPSNTRNMFDDTYKSSTLSASHKTTTNEKDRSLHARENGNVSPSGSTKSLIHRQIDAHKSTYSPIPEPRTRGLIKTYSNHSMDTAVSERGSNSGNTKDYKRNLTANDQVSNRSIMSLDRRGSNQSISSHTGRMTKDKRQASHASPSPDRSEVMQSRDTRRDVSSKSKSIEDENFHSKTGKNREEEPLCPKAGKSLKENIFTLRPASVKNEPFYSISGTSSVDKWLSSPVSQRQSQFNRNEGIHCYLGRSATVPERQRNTRSSAALMSQMDLILNKKITYDAKPAYNPSEQTSRLPCTLPRKNIFDADIGEKQLMYPQMSTNQFEPGILLFVFLIIVMFWRLGYHVL